MKMKYQHCLCLINIGVKNHTKLLKTRVCKKYNTKIKGSVTVKLGVKHR